MKEAKKIIIFYEKEINKIQLKIAGPNIGISAKTAGRYYKKIKDRDMEADDLKTSYEAAIAYLE